jgi:hypothetical protein
VAIYKVPVAGTIGKALKINTGDELTQAQVVALINQAFATYSPQFQPVQTGADVSTPFWTAIQEVPENIVDVAALASFGVLFRDPAGNIITIPIPIAPPGEPGEPGDDVQPGPPGEPGSPGPTGPTGPAGPSGSGSGAPGPPGEDGEDGEDGMSIPGPVGSQGPTGATGPTGSAGAAGAAGYGIPGMAGEDGDAGQDGAPGAAGAKGATGSTGTTGATGATGPTGSAGAVGATGQDGDDGGQEYYLITPAGSAFNLAANYVMTGQWTFNPVGVGVTITGSAAVYGLIVNGNASNSYGLQVNAGLSGSDICAVFVTNAGANVALSIRGDGKVFIFAPSGNNALTTQTSQMVFGNATDNGQFIFNGTGAGTVGGSWTFTAPTGATGLIAQGVDSHYAAEVIGSATSAKSFGLAILAGTTSADQSLSVLNQPGTHTYFNVLGAPTATTGVMISGYGLTAAALVDMTPDKGSYTATGTGFAATVPTCTAVWAKMGNLVTVTLTALQGTSNAATFTITGMPAILFPARQQFLACPAAFTDTTGTVLLTTVAAVLQTTGVITMYLNGSASGWATSGSKGINTGFGWTFTYELP